MNFDYSKMNIFGYPVVNILVPFTLIVWEKIQENELEQDFKLVLQKDYPSLEYQNIVPEDFPELNLNPKGYYIVEVRELNTIYYRFPYTFNKKP